MLEVSILNDKDAEVEKTQKVQLFLDVCSDGVDIAYKNSDGTTYYIARVDGDGTLVRYSELPEESGLKLDKNGRIKVAR